MKLHKAFAATALALMVSGPSFGADKASVEETLARAEQIHAQALELEHGWSVTEPFIEEARAALEAGDMESAAAIAERALLTAEQSLKQGQEEKTAWQDRVLGQ